MNNYLRQLRDAATSPPDPDRLRAIELRLARIELIQAIKAAEDYEVQAAAYRIKVDTLRDRIDWLGNQACLPTHPPHPTHFE
jgi:hypothetical protein